MYRTAEPIEKQILVKLNVFMLLTRKLRTGNSKLWNLLVRDEIPWPPDISNELEIIFSILELNLIIKLNVGLNGTSHLTLLEGV